MRPKDFDAPTPADKARMEKEIEAGGRMLKWGAVLFVLAGVVIWYFN
jgi:hypothetical protein